MRRSGSSALKVMIVDDEPYALNFLSRILQAIGVDQVIEARDGEEALAKLAALAPGALDVVISDDEMPGMDGYQLSRRIRFGTVPAFKDVPIVILGGELSDDNMRHARTHRVNALIPKPASVDVLRLELEAVLRGHNGETR